VDGIARGVAALAAGKVKNETINLACGQGNTLVRMAELVGQTLGKTPQITLAPTQLGEVTRYVADISKAKELLGYVPQVLLEQGIPRAVAWCRAWDAGKPT
jgi:UDP-glucose 4-epimerase